MYVLHGSWIPETTTAFVQEGAFYLWVETPEQRKFRKVTVPPRHPRHLRDKALAEFLANELLLPASRSRSSPAYPTKPRYFWLPAQDREALPSPELSHYLEEPIAADFALALFQIECCEVTLLTGTGFENPLVALLNQLYEQVVTGQVDCQMGADLLFWHRYAQTLPELIVGDNYIPALKCREMHSAPGNAHYEVYTGWEPIGTRYEAAIAHHAPAMPLACRTGQSTPSHAPQVHAPEALLRHLSEVWLTDLVTQTPLPRTLETQIENTLIGDCASASYIARHNNSATKLKQYLQWQVWRDRIQRTETDSAFYLGFRLDAPNQPADPWPLALQVILKSDPSVQLNLLDYWQMESNHRWAMRLLLGENFEQQLLLNLGQAARIYPLLWEGLETDQPVGVLLNAEAALAFLQETAWVLESAGYRVIVPSWWTAAGRRRLKLRMNARSKSYEEKSKSYFSMNTLVEYEYRVALGEETITAKEWRQLVNAKTPIVQIRGQWVVLDPSKLEEMRSLVEQPPQETSLLGFMRLSAEQDEDVEVVCDRRSALQEMINQLNNPSQLKLVDDPEDFCGQLRSYQKRGVSWMRYLDQLGLNGCLADDMGLGKTIQVIARLLQEREQGKALPTLLIVPTSVIGNWYHELHKFAPSLRAAIHHGADRAKDTNALQAACDKNDVIITSFGLARRDKELLQSVRWQRVVLDEAQNIKNPQAAQTKAINQLGAPHKLALTGTPVENRLMDLWSIFNFLNPGYLGNQKQFKEQFETPIQRGEDPQRSKVLKQLVEPFILRRVKTDQSIIQDLPDKIEQKLYCNLTKEQASLYAATVKDVMTQIQDSEGIQRKGIILSTLLKLKQICNHPRQFLQDDSEFSAKRSHKLSRLSEMIDEAIDEGESVLVFSQFTEIGAALERYFRDRQVNTYYLHGGTSRKRREQMISEFQQEQTPPSVFILSLKAGGVGITLTKANHVFHFDRWWNPAVEDQATDRAFRIGQQKKVFVHKFVAVGTLEERIDEMIEDKKKLAGAIVGSDESWLTELDNESFKQLIRLNQTAVL